jgi:immunoglobulin-binding protein 1
MDNQTKSLRQLFVEAEAQRKTLDGFSSTTDSSFQENLASAIAGYEECLRVADAVSLFSPNETLDDLNTNDLQYLLIRYHLAELTLKVTGGDRKANVLKAKEQYERFLKLLDQYDLLSKGDSKLYEEYKENPSSFSIASTNDAYKRREMKIQRFKEEKNLKKKLEARLEAMRNFGPCMLTLSSTSKRTLRLSRTTRLLFENSTSRTLRTAST